MSNEWNELRTLGFSFCQHTVTAEALLIKRYQGFSFVVTSLSLSCSLTYCERGESCQTAEAAALRWWMA